MIPNLEFYINALQQYAVFNGRAGRSEFWYFVFFNVLISFLLLFISQIIDMPILLMLYSLVVLVPAIALAVRRMHDVGKSGWYLLMPVYNIILACGKGDEGENGYGKKEEVGLVK